MSYIYIVCITLIIFFSFSLIVKKRKTLSEKIFVSWVILLALTELSFFLNAINKDENYTMFFSLICDTHILHGAFYYLYVQSFTDSNFRLFPKHLLHLIPFGAILSLKFYFNNVLEVMDCFGLGCIHTGNRYIDLLSFIKFSTLGAYLFFGWLTIYERVHHSNHKNELQTIRFTWLKNITIGIFIIYFIAVTYKVLTHLKFDFLGNPITVINIMVTFFILIFFYLGNTYAYLFVTPYNKTFIDLDGAATSSIQHRTEIKIIEPVTDQIGDIDNKFKQIEEFLIKQKPFLDGQFTIRQLADEINLPQNEISSIIQNKTDKYYCDYMNAYRVDALKEKLNDEKMNDFTVLSLALDCGFASKTSLNRIFKQHTGFTPTEYRNNSNSREKE